MEAVKKEFYRNQYGIDIVKCCASCKSHDSKGEDNIRYCKKTGLKHYLDYYCGKDWSMLDNLNNAGKGGGMVKRKEYIEYMSNNPSRRPEDFERIYGSRYLTKK